MLAWASLVHAGMFLTRGLDEELQSKCGFSLAEQDLLSQVDKSSGDLRMGDLAERLFFSKAGMTKMVDRLEEAGLVARNRSSDDRRAIAIGLTAAGKRELGKARRVLKAWVLANFAEHLSPAERTSFRRLLQKVLEGHGRWDSQLAHLGVSPHED